MTQIASPTTGQKFTSNKTIAGILMMALGMFIFSAVDTQAKYLTATLNPIQIVWVRQMGLLVCVVLWVIVKGRSTLHSHQPGLQVVRGVMAAGSATLFIVAIAYVPLVDAVAVSFIAPLVVTLLGALVLRERVGIRRWAAVIIGFAATLVVIRPGLGVIHPAVSLVLLAATLFAVRQVLSRVLGRTDSTLTTVAYTAVVGVAILTIPLPFVWRWPATGFEIAMLCSLALMAAAAEMCVIRALELAQAVVVAPLQYTLLIWSTAYGFLIFGQLPDLWTWVGAIIIVLTGAYTVRRDYLRSKHNHGEAGADQGG